MPIKSSTKRTVNVAVAGLGFMGVTHLRTYQQIRNVRIVAVCGAGRLPVNGVLRGVAGNIQQPDDINLGPGVRVYTDFAELLKDHNVDLVDICTPTALHPAQAIAALQAGKHVVCEKPLATTLSAARKVVRLAAKSPQFLMPAMCMRFWPGWGWLKAAVTENKYGRVLAAGFRRVSEKPAWSQTGTHAGGALLDLHIHDTDFVNFLFGRPSAVFAAGVADAGGGVDHVVTEYIYPDGPQVHAEGSWLLAQGFNMSFAIHCERATIDFDLARGPGALVISERGKKPKTVKLKATDGYAEEVRYFIDCVTQNRRPVTVSPEDCLTALEICLAEEKSVRTGRIVNL